MWSLGCGDQGDAPGDPYPWLGFRILGLGLVSGAGLQTRSDLYPGKRAVKGPAPPSTPNAADGGVKPVEETGVDHADFIDYERLNPPPNSRPRLYSDSGFLLSIVTEVS